jgi:enoyl-CoA hydratase/carnithine racemase
MSALEEMITVRSASECVGTHAADKKRTLPLVQVDLGWLFAPEPELDVLLRHFDSWVTEVEESDSAHVVLFTGLTCVASILEPPLSADQFRRWNKLIARVAELNAFTISVVDGLCTGRALQLAVFCDFRVGSASSSYRSTEGRDGLLPGLMTYRLPKLVGSGVAKRLILAGETFSAHTAVNAGLLDYVFPDNTVEKEALTFSHQFLPASVTSMRLARRLIEESYATQPESALGHHLAAYHHCLELVGR